MASERIDGIKYNFDREPDEVVTGVHSHLLERHRQLMADIERVTGILAVRGLVATPEGEDYYEQPTLFGEVPPLERGDLIPHETI